MSAKETKEQVVEERDRLRTELQKKKALATGFRKRIAEIETIGAELKEQSRRVQGRADEAEQSADAWEKEADRLAEKRREYVETTSEIVAEKAEALDRAKAAEQERNEAMLRCVGLEAAHQSLLEAFNALGQGVSIGKARRSGMDRMFEERRKAP